MEKQAYSKQCNRYTPVTDRTLTRNLVPISLQFRHVAEGGLLCILPEL